MKKIKFDFTFSTFAMRCLYAIIIIRRNNWSNILLQYAVLQHKLEASVYFILEKAQTIKLWHVCMYSRLRKPH